MRDMDIYIRRFTTMIWLPPLVGAIAWWLAGFLIPFLIALTLGVVRVCEALVNDGQEQTMKQIRENITVFDIIGFVVILFAWAGIIVLAIQHLH